jgi:hypothetical protein
MDGTEEIVQLLREIRDNQREAIAWRKQAVEKSLRLQRVAVLWQRVGLVLAGMLIAGGALLIARGLGWLGR